jgi:hypothetical protein
MKLQDSDEIRVAGNSPNAEVPTRASPCLHEQTVIHTALPNVTQIDRHDDPSPGASASMETQVRFGQRVNESARANLDFGCFPGGRNSALVFVHGEIDSAPEQLPQGLFDSLLFDKLRQVRVVTTGQPQHSQIRAGGI